MQKSSKRKESEGISIHPKAFRKKIDQKKALCSKKTTTYVRGSQEKFKPNEGGPYVVMCRA